MLMMINNYPHKLNQDDFFFVAIELLSNSLINEVDTHED